MSALVARMTTYAKETSKLDRIVLGVACGSVVLMFGMLSFWERHQQDLWAEQNAQHLALIATQQRSLDRLTTIMEMETSEVAALREMVNSNRRDLERERR